MCLKEIANKNTAWNSVQYHLFYQLDRCQKIQKSNFGNVQDKWIYSGWKNRCRQQTALYTGDWINGLHYNHMYTDLKKVLGINIAFVKHYHIILKIKIKKKKISAETAICQRQMYFHFKVFLSNSIRKLERFKMWLLWTIGIDMTPW